MTIETLKPSWPGPTEGQKVGRLLRVHPSLGPYMATHTFDEYFLSLRKDRDLHRGVNGFRGLEERVQECYRIALGEPMRGDPQW